MFRTNSSGMHGSSNAPWEKHGCFWKAGHPKFWVLGWDCERVSVVERDQWLIYLRAMMDEAVVKTVADFAKLRDDAIRRILNDGTFTLKPESAVDSAKAKRRKRASGRIESWLGGRK